MREDPHARVTARWTPPPAKYQALRPAHIADYRSLYNRVALDIGQARPTVPTEQLRASYNGQKPRPGGAVFPVRALPADQLVAAGRAAREPARDLEREQHAAWNCDYHSNINIQMIYWPAEVTQLGECH